MTEYTSEEAGVYRLGMRHADVAHSVVCRPMSVCVLRTGKSGKWLNRINRPRCLFGGGGGDSCRSKVRNEVLDGATWRIQLNSPCAAAAMRPCVKLL